MSITAIIAAVVPARAGMSLWDGIKGAIDVGGPRASGDEPVHTKRQIKPGGWSPRERG